MNFKQYVQGKSVIVVGPAPTLIGRNKQSFIEGFDIIVRCNNSCPIPQLLQPDYGSRCNVLYLNQVVEMIMREKLPIKTYKQYGVKFLRLKTAVFLNIKKIQREINADCIQEQFTRVRQQIHNTDPLIGHVAIRDILQYEPKRLHITGMDFYLNPGKEYTAKYSLHGYNRRRDLRFHEPILALQDVLKFYDASSIITADGLVTGILNLARGGDANQYIGKECKITVHPKNSIWCKIVPGKVGYNSVSLLSAEDKYIRHRNQKITSQKIGRKPVDLMDASFIVDSQLSNRHIIGLRSVNYMRWYITNDGTLRKNAYENGDIAKLPIGYR